MHFFFHLNIKTKIDLIFYEIMKKKLHYLMINYKN